MSDATERLRQAAQNEATCIELNRMLHERDADLARLTAELERSRRECEGLREAMESAIGLIIARSPHNAKWKLRAALSAGEKDHVPDA